MIKHANIRAIYYFDSLLSNMLTSRRMGKANRNRKVSRWSRPFSIVLYFLLRFNIPMHVLASSTSSVMSSLTPPSKKTRLGSTRCGICAHFMVGASIPSTDLLGPFCFFRSEIMISIFGIYQMMITLGSCGGCCSQFPHYTNYSMVAISLRT